MTFSMEPRSPRPKELRLKIGYDIIGAEKKQTAAERESHC